MEEQVGEMLDTYASMDLLRGHLSILAWNLMLAICRLRLSLSMLLLVELLELELRLLEKAGGPGLSTGRLLVAVGLTCQARRGLQPAFF